MLSRTLFHLYGPIYVYSFGLMIALGYAISFICAIRDPRRAHIITTDQFAQATTVALIAGIMGGRFLYLVSNYRSIDSWQEIFYLHEGGLSILGAVITVIIALYYYLKKNNIRVLLFMDLIANYAPLLQAISRLGCFFAGCCYGKPTGLPWGIIYTDPDTLAPLFCKLHPTQLYLAIGDLSIFFMLYFLKNRTQKSGIIFCSYLLLSSLNRFIIDFWRDDQEFLFHGHFSFFSLHQWLALIISIGALAGIIIIQKKISRNEHI